MRDPTVPHGRDQEEQRLAPLAGVVDPVNAGDRSAGARLDELVGADAAISGP
jgi:hypothetical protein